MRRTLQTAFYLFKDHPDFKSIKFVAAPLLRENLVCSCDIPTSDLSEIFNEFSDKLPNLDTTTMIETNNLKYWYIQYL